MRYAEAIAKVMVEKIGDIELLYSFNAEDRRFKELVRCKNCVWFDGFCCQNINNKRMAGMEIDDFEWFCANGERKGL